MVRILALVAALSLALGPALATAQTKVSSLPAAFPVASTDVFPASQNCSGAPPTAGCTATNGVTAAQLKSFTSSAPALTAPTVTTIAGAHALSSVTLGAAGQVGSGASIGCSAGHVCTSLSGEVSLVLGTGTLSAGTLFTLNFADTRVNTPSCFVQGQDTTSGAGMNANQFTRAPSTISLAVASDVVLTASHTLVFDYECSGN